MGFHVDPFQEYKNPQLSKKNHLGFLDSKYSMINETLIRMLILLIMNILI